MSIYTYIYIYIFLSFWRPHKAFAFKQCMCGCQILYQSHVAQAWHSHMCMSMWAHIDIHTESFYTLTINLQPIAQLDGVAMANILSPESSAKIEAREAERLILNMCCSWCSCKKWVKGKRKKAKRQQERREEDEWCSLHTNMVLHNTWLPWLEKPVSEHRDMVLLCKMLSWNGSTLTGVKSW